MPYKGASQGIIDLVGGHISSRRRPFLHRFANSRRGVGGVAHSGRERFPDFPDVPTFKEMGYDVVATTWFSISGPANLPKDITEKINREIVEAV